MMYITGDCHCNFERYNTEIFPEQKEMTKDDCVIICGDFGGVWDKDTSGKRKRGGWIGWRTGCYHDNKSVNAEDRLLYEQIIRIA